MNLGEAVSKQWFPPSHFDRLAIIEAACQLQGGGEWIPHNVVSPQPR